MEDGRKTGAPEIVHIERGMEEGWMIRQERTADEDLVAGRFRSTTRLHEGEAEALAMAASRNALLLADDKEARNVAKALGVRWIGTARRAAGSVLGRPPDDERAGDAITELTKVSRAVTRGDGNRAPTCAGGRNTSETTLPESIQRDLRQIQAAGHTDEQATLAGLPTKAIDDWKPEHNAQAYGAGKISMARAAQESGVTLWKMTDYVRSRKISVPYDRDDLREDLDEIYRQLGRNPDSGIRNQESGVGRRGREGWVETCPGAAG